MPDVLLGLAHQLGGDVAKALPWTTYDAMLRAAFVPLRTRGGSIDAKTDDDFWDAAQTQGGWWSGPSARRRRAAARLRGGGQARAHGDGRAGICRRRGDFPFYFLPYVSQSFGDGSLAPSALAAGAARRAHLGHVVELGRDQSQDRRAVGH
jgi:hypothetical protein